MSPCILTVDQSTSATKVFLIDDRGQVLRRLSTPHHQFYPHPGHVEHDAAEIWTHVARGLAEMAEAAPSIAGISLTNQRETTVLWDRDSGEPVCRAIVWQDVRAEGLCRGLSGYAGEIRGRTGLALSAYFPAAKAAHVLRENPEIRAKAEAGSLCIGTMDSYLVYRLTGGAVFQTDVSNASRTQLMRLDTLAWDAELCGLFGIPMQCLPSIAHCDASFGMAGLPGTSRRLPITGVLGDSHAALFGQGCRLPGMAKATYGTGSSVMMHTGHQPALSAHGLSTSVGYAVGGQVCYVLEGNVTCSGDTLCWMRDEAGLLPDIDSAEPLARSVPDTGGVYFVPAFSGLGAPYSDGGARALLCGMSRGTTRAQIVRAALESMAYQNADIIAAMGMDMGKSPRELRVDGGPTHNEFLMQFQADLLGCPVQCAAASELSALGAWQVGAVALGLCDRARTGDAGRRYEPGWDQARRAAAARGWKEAVRRCRTAAE